mmetsp:Transcript_11692/g.17569  ORF Transcript_11692/g.17569 Transcript_11692/m.17569 type:complete len:242 (+) Transcript_11692:1-726(+)
MRLQWWKDMVKTIFKEKEMGGDPQQLMTTFRNPVVGGLIDVIFQRDLSISWFNRIHQSREEDVRSDDIRFQSIEDLERYAEFSASAFLYLIIEQAGFKGHHDLEHAASHLGKAMGILSLLRATPHHLSKRRCYLPIAVLSDHRLVAEHLFQGDPASLSKNEALSDAVFELCSIAKLHLDSARALGDKIPKDATSVLLSSVLADSLLDRFQKGHFNVYDERLRQPSPMMQIALWKHRLLKSF